jgi:DNA gyrase subunit A
VLPAKLPNLLINGSSGIAVGMTTNIPPHNLTEVVAATKALIDNPEIDIFELMNYLQGPDFPTGGSIYGIEGVKQAYLTGKGRAIVRAKYDIEEMPSGKTSIIINEIPYQVNKLNLINKIVELIKDKKLDGIADLRDESDRDGLRIVIEVKKDFNPNAIMNFLFKHSPLQVTFGMILLALVQGRPQILNLKEIIQHYIDHRIDVVVRRTKFDLDKAEKRAHILEGLRIAIDNIDEIVEIIKTSENPDVAKVRLIERFVLSEIQAKAILEMRLQRLTGLERDKIEKEYRELLELIEKLKAILENKFMQLDIIKEEMDYVENKYSNPRRTEIIPRYDEISIEDLINAEDVVVTITHSGSIKRFPLSGYRRQNRGGRGVAGAQIKDEDFIEHLFVASTHDYILFFTDRGRCYWLKVYEIPQGGRSSKGRPIINLIDIEQGEKVQAYMTVANFDQKGYVLIATKNGIVKKTDLSAYSKPRRGGIIAINIREDDRLIEAKLSTGESDVMLITRNGLSIRFNETQIRSMGRTATGVKGIRLRKDDLLIAMLVVDEHKHVFTISENGFGKRTPVEDFRLQNRSGSGIIAMKLTKKTGALVDAIGVVENEDLMVITQGGVVIRQNIENISIIGRNTQGVKIIRLDADDYVSDVAKVVQTEDVDEEDAYSDDE